MDDRANGDQCLWVGEHPEPPNRREHHHYPTNHASGQMKGIKTKQGLALNRTGGRCGHYVFRIESFAHHTSAANLAHFLN